MDLDSTIEKTISQIQKLMNANSIAGNPIPAGDRIIIPISKTALGFGVGVASNAKKDEDSALGGADMKSQVEAKDAKLQKIGYKQYIAEK